MVADELVATCGACAHAWDAHDALGARYCTATMASTRERGCICLRGGRIPAPAPR